MKKSILSIAMAAAVVSCPIMASDNNHSGMGFGVGYGALSGATLEINYPLSDSLIMRGTTSAGMGLSQTQVEDGITYNAKADGGIHRLALNYHPFQGNFFLSGGYAVNNFNLGVSGTGTGSVTVGSDTFNNTSLSLAGKVKWDSAPTVTMGWGNSAASGWGLMAEFGVMLTGAAKVSLTGTGTYDNGGGAVDVSSDPTFQNALKAEEDKLKADIATLDFLPIIQLQANYRF